MNRYVTALVLLLPAAALAQAPAESAPEANPLGFSRVDRATVRVLAVRGVAAMRIDSQSGGARMLAVPDAGHGSGVIIDPSGIVLTARHVVADAALLAVWAPGRDRAFPAAVVYEDRERDIAFLAISGAVDTHVELTPAPALHVRQEVHAIGYPLDPRRTDPQSSRGIVAGIVPEGFIQLDMALNPGNSGGPLIDADERVVGLIVARGNPDAGVQNIGFAQPLAPLAEAFAGHVVGSSALERARERLSAPSRTEEIARLVTLLVRVGSVELIRDVIAVLDGGRRSEILDPLRGLAQDTQDPEVLALMAAYFWDAAAVILERAGGAMRVSQLPPGPERELASELMDHALTLCHRAARLDPLIARRSSFVARVTYYFAPPSAAPAAPSAPVVASVGAPRTASDSSPMSQAPPAPSPYHDPRVLVRLDVGPVTQPRGGFGLEPGAAMLGVAWSPATLRVGLFALDARLGGSVQVGGWGGEPLFGTHADVGVSLRFGDRYGAMVGAAWSPGLLLAGPQGRGFTAASWKAFAGAQLDVITLGLAWHGLQLDHAAAFHVLSLFAELGW